MPTVTDIDQDDCVALLSTATFGHIALSVRAMPRISPVQFTVSHGRVLAHLQCDRDDVGAALDNAVVALQADGLDGHGQMWSVHVVGRVRSRFGPEFEVEPVMVSGCRADLRE